MLFSTFSTTVWTAWISLYMLICVICTVADYMHKQKFTLDTFIFGLAFLKKDRRLWTKLSTLQILVAVWSLCAIVGMKLFSAVFVEQSAPPLGRKVPFSNVQELAKLIEMGKLSFVVRLGSPEIIRLNLGKDRSWDPLRKVKCKILA